MSPTIQARAEAATSAISAYLQVGMHHCTPEGRQQVSAIIARHFADMEKLRAAAERAEKAIKAFRFAYTPDGHTAPHDCFATGPLTGNPFADYIACLGCAAEALANDALTALRAALTPDAAADGTKGENL